MYLQVYDSEQCLLTNIGGETFVSRGTIKHTELISSLQSSPD